MIIPNWKRMGQLHPAIVERGNT